MVISFTNNVKFDSCYDTVHVKRLMPETKETLKSYSARISNKIVYIHGTKDHTLPIKNVSASYIVDKGSHMMILTKGDDISELINVILSNK